MTADYIPILIYGLFVLAIGVGAIVFSGLATRWLRIHRPTRIKREAYECGIPATGDTRRPFGVHFYVTAMVFLLFDVELVFFYPWAVGLRALGWFGLVEMAVFIGILAAGYVYLWKAGAFQWER
ncbi:MAG: NADH-quinone oxidoreductase subunit A [Planctomycetes bacterium]|nr:NADH-quinone oxidoreductase subunit A [Planctomycetota bacterium]